MSSHPTNADSLSRKNINHSIEHEPPPLEPVFTIDYNGDIQPAVNSIALPAEGMCHIVSDFAGCLTIIKDNELHVQFWMQWHMTIHWRVMEPGTYHLHTYKLGQSKAGPGRPSGPGCVGGPTGELIVGTKIGDEEKRVRRT
jgi:hypothetical protein